MDVSAKRSVTRAPTESDAELRGRQIGDFVLRECIGEGGFAAVYRCEQPLLGREAVVKVLHQRLRGSEEVFQRFMREARLASRLSHPYAAHVYAFGVEPEDGLAWIAMELVHGTSLEHWLSERGPLPLDVLVPFFEQVAEVVQDAHDHGIVHRDLKPSNVMMIESAGHLFPKLLDFGIAKLVDDTAQLEMPGVPVEVDDGDTLPALEDSGDQRLTQANATLGSPPYMSPEQWCDPLAAGPRSDLYSLAVMAYEALTGGQPFTGPTIAAIGERHCNADVPPVGARFPAALDRVFQRALAKAPADRPASALAFARELRAAGLPPHDTGASGVRIVELGPALAKRKASQLVAGVAALVIGGVAVYALLSDARGDRDRAAPPARGAIASPAEPGLLPASGAVMSAGAVVVAPAAQATVRATVLVKIDSTPPGAEVLRLPSATRVGVTPWSAELPSEDAMQVFVLKKPGFTDRRVEVDLRSGGTSAVKLVRPVHRPAASSPPAPPLPSPAPLPVESPPARRKGDPVDPFPTTKAR